MKLQTICPLLMLKCLFNLNLYVSNSVPARLVKTDERATVLPRLCLTSTVKMPYQQPPKSKVTDWVIDSTVHRFESLRTATASWQQKPHWKCP